MADGTAAGPATRCRKGAPVGRRPRNIGVMRLPAAVAGLVAVLTLWASPAEGQYRRPDFESQRNPSLEAAEDAAAVSKLEQKPGWQVPPELAFTDSTGRQIALGDYFGQGKPILLQPAYFGCPVLCTKVSEGIATSVAALDLPPEDYTVLTVSFVPTETTALAADKKRASVAHAKKPDMADSWHFLTGEQDAIDGLLASVGYSAGYVEQAGQWAHPDAVVVLTPEGRVLRYLRGTHFNPQTLKLSLVEASDNKVGSVADHLFLTCFQYDPVMGKYTPFARGLMRWAALLTVLLIAGGVAFLLLRERSRGGDDGRNDGRDDGVSGDPRPAVA